MRNKEKELSLSSSIGYSFMLTIMIILTFVIFAVLSLSTSLRDYDYSRRAAEKTTAYYEANSKAYNILKQIDKKLKAGASLEDSLKEVSKLPQVIVEREKEELAVVSYKVEITKHQELQILLEITAGESGTADYRILNWKEASSEVWEENATLPVIGTE